jgi:hypothetical protein
MQQKLFNYKSDLYKKFIEYDAVNPEIYQMFKKFTFQVIESGYQNSGSQMIIERLRWESIVVAKNDKFKINNDYAAFYSRKFMKEYPMHNKFFRIRLSVADELNLSDL